MGVDYRDSVRIETLEFAEDGATIVGRAGEEAFHLHAGLLIDATGPRGFLHRSLRLEESPLPGLPPTESLYSHFTGVARTETAGDAPPYPVDDAAVHHVFEGGWVWVLRFNNGVTSAGVAATRRVAEELALSEGEPAWQTASGPAAWVAITIQAGIRVPAVPAHAGNQLPQQHHGRKTMGDVAVRSRFR